MKSYKELFNKMLNDCHKYDTANNAKIPFPTEPLIMALLLSQHKMIDWLNDQIKLLMRDFCYEQSMV